MAACAPVPFEFQLFESFGVAAVDAGLLGCCCTYIESISGQTLGTNCSLAFFSTFFILQYFHILKCKCFFAESAAAFESACLPAPGDYLSIILLGFELRVFVLILCSLLFLSLLVELINRLG